jgi:tyrosinase
MDAKTLLSRREVLKGLGAMGALSFAGFMGGCEELIEIIENRPVRRDISKLSPTDPIIQTYQAAVSAMKALPSTDLRNWNQQALIHYNHCPHGNWYFLPWHRAYLLAFEQICRKLTGNSDFALPYWNWTANASVPSVFWGASNPLFDPNRSVTATDVADPNFVGPTVVDSILNEPNFFLFASGQVTGQRDFGSYGRLEGRPHNYIHGWIDNSDMGSYMSPLDPVFWTHHNMIECCWIEWNIERHHANTNDPQWMNFNVSVVDTLLYPLLSYRFEPCKPNVGAGPMSKRLSRAEAKSLVKFVKHGAKVRLDFVKRYTLQRSLEVTPGHPTGGTIQLDPKQFHDALISESSRRLLLTLGGVELPDKADYFIRVFVNKPDASAETPLEDPHYAGSFAFFFDESAHHHGSEPSTSKPGYIVEVGETLRRLNSAGSLPTDQVSIQLIPVTFPHREAKPNRFSVQSLELGIAKVTK